MQLCFILGPGFSSLALSLARDVFRAANGVAGSPLVSVHLRSLEGVQMRAGDGMLVAAEKSGWQGASGLDLVAIFAGEGEKPGLPMAFRQFLRTAEDGGATLAGFGGGAALLEQVGLLEGHARSDAIAAADFLLDGNRLLARHALGTGPALLAWLAQAQSATLAEQTAKALHIPFAGRDQVRNSPDPVLARMLALMKDHLPKPLPISLVAQSLGVSQKQLRLRCVKLTGLTPAQTYQRIRLEHAEDLVTQTRLPITEVARATGYDSASAFTRRYRAIFGHSPRLARSA